MVAVVDGDISIAANGDIRWTGLTTTYNTVLEVHRWLMGKADDAQAIVDDLMDITFDAPSDRKTDTILTLNTPYNIDDAMAQQMFDGSVSQAGGGTVYSGLEVVGAVETGTQLMIVQDNALITSWWGTGINSDATKNILMRTLIKTRVSGVDIDGKRIRVMARELNDKYAEYGLTLGLGNSTAAIFTEPDLNNTTIEATIAGWTTITNVEGYQLIDLNNGNGAQPYYSQWDRDIYTINQLYERTKWIGRRASVTSIHSMNGQLFRGITSEWEYDGQVGSFTEDNVLAWGTSFDFNTGVGVFTIDEAVTFGTSGAVGQIRYYSGAGATGNVVISVDSGSGTVVLGETMTGVTSSATAVVGTVVDAGALGGTGHLIADDTVNTVWIQLLTGSLPVNNLPIYERGTVFTTTHLVNITITARSVKPEFFGQSTGTAMIGNFGLGVQAADLTVNDKLFDLLNVPQSPPNNQTFDVKGLVIGEDRVITAPNSGTDTIDYAQMILSVSLIAVGETAIVSTTPIPADTPTSGTVRVTLDSGIRRRVAYTSWAASTFTIAATDFSADNATAPKDLWISYIDLLATAVTESYTAIYGVDRSLVVFTRDGGSTPIKPDIKPATFGSSGGSVTVTRTSDL